MWGLRGDSRQAPWGFPTPRYEGRYIPVSHGTAIEKIRFHEDEILSVLGPDGRPHVVLRPAIEAIGIDYPTQLTKLRSRSWATVGKTYTVAEDGKTREMVTVDVRTFLMLLATVNEEKVSPEVKDRLIAYQAESADVIEGYWTRGGTVNPRASETQLAELAEDIEERRRHLAAVRVAERIEAQVRVLTAMAGIVDPQWLAAQAQERFAVATGRELEQPFQERTLTVSEFLAEKNLPSAVVRSMSGTFGKAMKQAYRQRTGEEPGKSLRFVEGAQREVAAYREEHRPLMEQVWRDMNS